MRRGKADVRPSVGTEWSSCFTPTSWLTLDADLAFTKARFRDDEPAGNRIPGAVERVIAAGVSIHDLDRMFGTVQLRHFGPRSLIESNSVRSEATTLVNAELGYELDPNWFIGLSALNLLESEGNDIDHYCASHLPGKRRGGVEDYRFLPVEPRQSRLTLIARF